MNELKSAYKNEEKTNENLDVLNFDLEAVLYTPCDKVCTFFYKRKLCPYNCTIYTIWQQKQDLAIWVMKLRGTEGQTR